MEKKKSSKDKAGGGNANNAQDFLKREEVLQAVLLADRFFFL